MQVTTDNLVALARQAHTVDERVNDQNPDTQGQLAKEFEGIFLSLLIKEMRNSSFDGEGLFQGDKSDIYGGMFDQFMAQHLTNGAGLGIAELMLPKLESPETTDLEPQP